MPPRPIALTVVLPIRRSSSWVSLARPCLGQPLTRRAGSPCERRRSDRGSRSRDGAARGRRSRPGTPVGLAVVREAADGAGAGDRAFAVRAPTRRRCDAVRPVTAELRAAAGLVVGARRPRPPCSLDALRVPPSWDLAAVHRLLHGGSRRRPGAGLGGACAACPRTPVPRTGQLDLLSGDGRTDPGDGDPDDPVRPDGYLRPELGRGRAADGHCGGPLGLAGPRRARGAAGGAGRAARRPAAAARRRTLPVLTAWSESAAELLAVELAAGGLPLDRADRRAG